MLWPRVRGVEVSKNTEAVKVASDDCVGKILFRFFDFILFVALFIVFFSLFLFSSFFLSLLSFSSFPLSPSL